jgi:hypothetical protein
MPDTATKRETVKYAQWGYAIERRWQPGKSKPLLVGFARILASNYDRRTGYICVSHGILARQCGMSTRATGELFRRVVNDHKLFCQVGQYRPNKGGKSIAKLVWQLPPDNMQATGATEVDMPTEAESATGGILPVDDPWADGPDSQQEEFDRPSERNRRSEETPIGRILPIISSRDYLSATDAQASYASDDLKTDNDSGMLPSRQERSVSEARYTNAREIFRDDDDINPSICRHGVDHGRWFAAGSCPCD